MRDELAHKRQLELAQVTKVPTAPQPIPGKHNVPVTVHTYIYTHIIIVKRFVLMSNLFLAANVLKVRVLV